MYSQPKANLVKVEPEIGEAKLKNLADVCFKSEKSVLLNLGTGQLRREK